MGQGWEVGPCAPAIVDICPNNAKADFLVCHSNVLQYDMRQGKRIDAEQRATPTTARELRLSHAVHSSTGALTVQTSCMPLTRVRSFSPGLRDPHPGPLPEGEGVKTACLQTDIVVGEKPEAFPFRQFCLS